MVAETTEEEEVKEEAEVRTEGPVVEDYLVPEKTGEVPGGHERGREDGRSERPTQSLRDGFGPSTLHRRWNPFPPPP